MGVGDAEPVATMLSFNDGVPPSAQVDVRQMAAVALIERGDEIRSAREEQPSVVTFVNDEFGHGADVVMEFAVESGSGLRA